MPGTTWLPVLEPHELAELIASGDLTEHLLRWEYAAWRKAHGFDPSPEQLRRFYRSVDRLEGESTEDVRAAASGTIAVCDHRYMR